MLRKNEHAIITTTLHVVLCKTSDFRRLGCLRETKMSVRSQKKDKGGINANQVIMIIAVLQ